MQLGAVVAGVVLDQGIDAIALEDVPVDNVVLDVVAVVNDKGEIDHQSGAVALAVAAGVGVVGRQTVVGPELVLVKPIDDDASAGALWVRGVVFVAAHRVEFLLVDGVRVNGEVNNGVRIVGVLRDSLAAVEGHSGQKEQ